MALHAQQLKLWGACMRGVQHLVDEHAVIQDHGQVEDGCNGCDALCQVNQLLGLLRVHHIQVGDGDLGAGGLDLCNELRVVPRLDPPAGSQCRSAIPQCAPAGMPSLAPLACCTTSPDQSSCTACALRQQMQTGVFLLCAPQLTRMLCVYINVHSLHPFMPVHLQSMHPAWTPDSMLASGLVTQPCSRCRKA